MFSRIKLFAVGISLSIPALGFAVEIVGAGSSAAKPLYDKWAAYYTQKNAITVNYQPTGSSDGIQKIKAKAVHFGATDVTPSLAELNKANIVSFPTAISGVVPVINLPGVKPGELMLTGDVLAQMFAGTITKWDAPAIAVLNPKIKLPQLPIALVVRQDGSGTTYNFTHYLSQVNPAWKTGFGTNFSIKWPASATQVKGSSGVVATVKQTSGSIGYVDYSYVVQDKLVYSKLKNRDGNFVAPSPTGFSNAVASSGWKTKASFDEPLIDKSGSLSWPITMGTFVLVPKVAHDPAATIATLKFFTWSFLHGDEVANGTDFVRLPDAIQAKVFNELTKITDKDGKPLSWSLM